MDQNASNDTESIQIAPKDIQKLSIPNHRNHHQNRPQVTEIIKVHAKSMNKSIIQ